MIGSVAIISWRQANAVDATASISINNENWLVSRIQYYGIGGLRPDTVDSKKLFADVTNITGKQRIEIVIVMLSEPVGKRLEFSCFSVIVTTGADKGSQFRQAETA